MSPFEIGQSLIKVMFLILDEINYVNDLSFMNFF